MATPRNHGAAWEEEHDDQIIQLLKEGKRLPDIAEIMGRTEGSILRRMEYIRDYLLKFAQLKQEILEQLQ